MLIDTHAHLNFNVFEKDREAVLKSSLNLDMGLVMPGTRFETSQIAVQLAEYWNNPRVWAAVGLHPIHLENVIGDDFEDKLDAEETENIAGLQQAEKLNIEKYYELAKSEKVIAIGEVGLDYWNRPKTKDKGAEYVARQIETLKAQIYLALSVKKPMILHCRVAHKDLLKLLAEHKYTGNPPEGGPGVIHSYTGSVKQLKKFLQMGYYIGINGLVFKLQIMADAAYAAPLERIVLETDSPYLVPPQITEERNEPPNIKYIARKIAELKGVSLQDMEKQTTENARRVFGVDFNA